MKPKYLLLTALSAGIAAYAAMRHANKLKLIYNEESGQLIIDRMHHIRICNDVFIESIVVFLNGEIYKGFDFTEHEKTFDNAVFVEVPDLMEGDRIEVKMKTRCTRHMHKRGKLAII